MKQKEYGTNGITLHSIVFLRKLKSVALKMHQIQRARIFFVLCISFLTSVVNQCCSLKLLKHFRALRKCWECGRWDRGGQCLRVRDRHNLQRHCSMRASMTCSSIEPNIAGFAVSWKRKPPARACVLVEGAIFKTLAVIFMFVESSEETWHDTGFFVKTC